MNLVCEVPTTLVEIFLKLPILPAQSRNYCFQSLGIPVVLSSTSASNYVLTFTLTLLIEAPFYFLVFSAFLKANKPKKTFGILAFSSLLLCNLATHPLVYFGFPFLFRTLGSSYGSMLLSAEIFAPTLESILLVVFWKVAPSRALFMMILANLFSWEIGARILYS